MEFDYPVNFPDQEGILPEYLRGKTTSVVAIITRNNIYYKLKSGLALLEGEAESTARSIRPNTGF